MDTERLLNNFVLKTLDELLGNYDAEKGGPIPNIDLGFVFHTLDDVRKDARSVLTGRLSLEAVITPDRKEKIFVKAPTDGR